MLTDRNQLPPPSAIQRPAFEDLVKTFKSNYLANIRADNPALADQVEKTLEQPGELLTKMCETFTQHLLNEVERRNQQARQLLPGWASGTNLDALVMHQGIKRQVLDSGDPDAFPPVPPTQESDEHLLLRYLLAPHAPAAGSRMQYKATVLTLDERPVITVDKPAANQVRLTYTFSPDGKAAQIKDGDGIRTAPGAVMVPVLARDGNGSPSDELLETIREFYLQRDDTAPMTDDITVQGAEIVPYMLNVTAFVGRGPDLKITEDLLQKSLQAHADKQHRLGGEIRPDEIAHLLYQAGAKRPQVTAPAAVIECQPHQAPYCTGINVEVLRL